MATAGSARFTAACGVLSRYVHGKQTAEKSAARETEARSTAMVTLPLMPGADVSTTTQEEQEPAGPPATSCASQAQMTIFYGGRMMVLHDVPADKAAELLRLAASSATTAKGAGLHGQVLPAATDDDVPVARKASLQRFMERRKGRVAARGEPYLRRPDDGACSAGPDRLELAL